MRISLLLAIMSISSLFAGNLASQTLSLDIQEMSVGMYYGKLNSKVSTAFSTMTVFPI